MHEDRVDAKLRNDESTERAPADETPVNVVRGDRDRRAAFRDSDRVGEARRRGRPAVVDEGLLEARRQPLLFPPRVEVGDRGASEERRGGRGEHGDAEDDQDRAESTAETHHSPNERSSDAGSSSVARARRSRLLSTARRIPSRIGPRAGRASAGGYGA